MKTLVEDAVALELAIWFHDAVYDPRASDNEERSAQLARVSIGGTGGAPELAEKVGALVLATKTHEPGEAVDAPWMLDIDLAILGQTPEVFAEYEAGIRAEYAWVEAETFRVKRRDVLQCFLDRPRIYGTEYFRTRFESSARANLARSIARPGETGE